jgi:hypothetical protein
LHGRAGVLRLKVIRAGFAETRLLIPGYWDRVTDARLPGQSCSDKSVRRNSAVRTGLVLVRDNKEFGMGNGGSWNGTEPRCASLIAAWSSGRKMKVSIR